MTRNAGQRWRKYHGLGNDYLIPLDREEATPDTVDPALVQRVCHPHYGLGSDGILYGPYPPGSPFFQRLGQPGALCAFRILNPDGSEAENSGNGICIFAKYLHDAGYVTERSFVLHTPGGPVSVTCNNESNSDITVSMGRLSFSRGDISCVDTPEEVVDVPLQFGEETFSCTCVSIGNPHCVIPMSNVYKKRVCEIGEFSESARYFPNRINTQIVKVLDRNNIQIEIFERGVGYTPAAGSCSCAAAGAVHKLGLTDSDVCVHMPGGKLQVHIDEDWNVTLTGTVCSVGKMILTDEFIRNNQIGR